MMIFDRILYTTNFLNMSVYLFIASYSYHALIGIKMIKIACKCTQEQTFVSRAWFN